MSTITTDVNQFPTLTWNHLNINRTHLDIELTKGAKQDVSPLPSGIFKEELKPLDIAKKRGANFIESALGKNFDIKLDELLCKQNINVNYFYIKENTNTKTPVTIKYFANNQDSLVTDTIIEAKEGSSSTFIFDFSSEQKDSGSFGSRITIYAQKNSLVHLVVVNRLGSGFIYFNSIGSSVDDNAKIDVTQIELGGAKNYTGSYVNLFGYNAFCSGQLGYLVKNNNLLDVNYVAKQTGRNTESSMAVEGVVKDSAQKVWRGTIDFVRGAVDSKGEEQENVLLLSPTVVNKTLPVILCDEEAVEGHHGSSIGKLGKDILFYMQSRGIDTRSAEQIMVKAKIASICRHIPDEQLVENIQKFLEGAL